MTTYNKKFYTTVKVDFTKNPLEKFRLNSKNNPNEETTLFEFYTKRWNLKIANPT